MNGRLVLADARLADGRSADVVVDGDTGRIVTVGAAPGTGVPVLDLHGRLLLPAPAEPHAHLDKALTADRVLNPSGDLLGAIVAWRAFRATLTVDDIAERAEAAARRLLANGCTAIRTHVDVGEDIGTRGVEALVRVRKELDGLVDLQIAALVATPTTGVAGASNRASLRDAIDAGADVVGGCPHIDPDPHGVIAHCVEVAAEAGLPLDLHMDETLDPNVFGLPFLCDRVAGAGLPLATASHCVSLGMQDEATQRRIAERCAATGVAVVTLPQTNLFLQGRQHRTAVPRGLTALRALLDAGAVVAGGADNLQDPFNLMGRGDPLETAALLVMAGHLTPVEAFTAVSAGARQALGLEAGGLVPAPGDRADLLAVAGPGVAGAIADAAPARIVVRAGRVVVTGGCASD